MKTKSTTEYNNVEHRLNLPLGGSGVCSGVCIGDHSDDREVDELKLQIKLLKGDNAALLSKIAHLHDELNKNTIQRYCRKCGEHTKHIYDFDNLICEQCIVADENTQVDTSTTASATITIDEYRDIIIGLARKLVLEQK